MASAPYLIRKAVPGDEVQIHDAHMRSIREVCIKDHGEDEVKGWGNRPLGDRWTNPILSGTTWVVEIDGVIKGFGFIRITKEENSAKAHIHGLYLAPEALRLGAGRAVTELMLNAARNSGVHKITLESSLTAHDFYKKMGFEDIGPMQYSTIGGSQVRYFPMATHL